MRFIANSRNLAISLVLAAFLPSTSLFAYSANRVWFEVLDSGYYRVRVMYTVPALKEFREAHAIYKSKKEAEAYYWHLVRGGEFATGGDAKIWFLPAKEKANPW